MTDYIDKFKSRPLSWSSISSFEYSKEIWYEKYILGKEEPPSAEMIFGKKIAKCIEDGTCEILGVTDFLQKKKEHKFNVMFSGIPLVGFADAFDENNFKKLDEVKTGKKTWNQKRVNDHRQIDMYLLMNFITNKIKPEDVECTLYWIPTQNNGDFSISFVEPLKVKRFKTKRTLMDILNFGVYIKRIYREMEDYIKSFPQVV